MGQLSNALKIEGYLCVSAATAGEVAKRLRLAEVYLRGVKGDAWYDELVVVQAADPTDQGVLDAEEAESLLAFYFALPHLNLRIDDSGGILLQEWTDDGAGGRLQKVFTTLRTLELVRRELLSQAKCLVYEGPVVAYADEGETVVCGVGDVGATTGLYVSAVTVD